MKLLITFVDSVGGNGYVLLTNSTLLANEIVMGKLKVAATVHGQVKPSLTLEQCAHPRFFCCSPICIEEAEEKMK